VFGASVFFVLGMRVMSKHKHDIESMGAKPRDHEHPRHHFLKHIHRDWRFQTAVVLMLILMLVYVFTKDLSIWPGSKRAHQAVPADVAP
jgi:hypothetical protein